MSTDEEIWVRFAAAAMSGLIQSDERTVAEDVDLAAYAADKMLQQLQHRRSTGAFYGDASTIERTASESRFELDRSAARER